MLQKNLIAFVAMERTTAEFANSKLPMIPRSLIVQMLYVASVFILGKD